MGKEETITIKEGIKKNWKILLFVAFVAFVAFVYTLFVIYGDPHPEPVVEEPVVEEPADAEEQEEQITVPVLDETKPCKNYIYTIETHVDNLSPLGIMDNLEGNIIDMFRNNNNCIIDENKINRQDTNMSDGVILYNLKLSEITDGSCDQLCETVNQHL